MPRSPLNSLQLAWLAVWESLHSYGKIGRVNADASITIEVPGKPHYVYVRTGTDDPTGFVEAFNAGAPRKANVRVRMLKIAGTNYIVSIDYPSLQVGAKDFNVAYHEHGAESGLEYTFGLGPTQTVTIASGAITISKSNVLVLPEGGLSDNLDVINGGVEGQIVLIRPANSNPAAQITVRVKPNASPCNISLRGSGNNRTLIDARDSLHLIYNAAANLWDQVGPETLNSLIGVVVGTPSDGEVLTSEASSGNVVFLPTAGVPTPVTLTGDVTGTGTSTVATTIANDAVTYAKMQNVSATDRFLGRDTAGAGDAEEITPAAARTILNVADGANAYVHPNHTGDVTSAADGATTIANDAVTNAKLADVATSTLKGRVTAATGDPEDLTATQARTLLNIEDGADVTDAGNIASSIVGATEKVTPVDADRVAGVNSVGGVLTWFSWDNIKATLLTYFNGLYVALTGNQTISGIKTFSSSETHFDAGAATSASIRFAIATVVKGYLGVTGSAGGFITGSVAGDIILRSESQKILFSTDAGSTAHMVLGGGNVSIGTTASSAPLTVRVGSNKNIWLDVGGWGTNARIVAVDDTSALIPLFLQASEMIVASGNVGIGTTAPQGRLHAHDGTGGMLFVTKTGLVNAAQTLIPDGTNDVVRGITGFFVVDDGSGAVMNVFSLVPSGFTDVVVGGFTMRLALSAGGALTAIRQSGVGTATLAVQAVWL